jgi:hypothetical protein
MCSPMSSDVTATLLGAMLLGALSNGYASALSNCLKSVGASINTVDSARGWRRHAFFLPCMFLGCFPFDMFIYLHEQKAAIGWARMIHDLS